MKVWEMKNTTEYAIIQIRYIERVEVMPGLNGF